jgi:thioredoxin 1
LSKNFAIALIIIAAASAALTAEKLAQQRPAGSAAVADKIQWTSDLDAGLMRARNENKPVMIDFVAEWCGPCKAMDESSFSNADVIRKAQAFVPVRIDIDRQKAVAAKYNGLARAYGGAGIPNILFLSGNGTKLKQFIGYKTATQLISAMDSALKSLK